MNKALILFCVVSLLVVGTAFLKIMHLPFATAILTAILMIQAGVAIFLIWRALRKTGGIN